MKRIAAIVAALGLVACASAPRYRPPAGNTAYGTYPFKNVVQNANPPMVLEGTVLVLPDTVMMTLGGKSCSPNSGNRSTTMFSYNCGEFSFYYNKENPLRSNGYRVPTTVWQTRRVCDVYRDNPATKAPECTRYRQERFEARIVLNGSLAFLAR
jgi:hypothetical protein